MLARNEVYLLNLKIRTYYKTGADFFLLSDVTFTTLHKLLRFWKKIWVTQKLLISLRNLKVTRYAKRNQAYLLFYSDT